MSCSLSDSFALRSSFSQTLPPLHIDPIREQRWMDGFQTMLHYFDFIPETQLRDILTRYHLASDELGKDEEALLFACFCLGRYREITMTDLGTTDRSDTEYFRRAIHKLEQSKHASLTSLSECSKMVDVPAPARAHTTPYRGFTLPTHVLDASGWNSRDSRRARTDGHANT